MFQILGILGVAISVAAYVPQVVHLWREGCSAGVSSRAWAMWLISSVLILTLALHQREPVFIALQVVNLASITVTLLLARKYRGMVCDFHAHLVSRRPATTTGRTASPCPASTLRRSAAVRFVRGQPRCHARDRRARRVPKGLPERTPHAGASLTHRSRRPMPAASCPHRPWPRQRADGAWGPRLMASRVSGRRTCRVSRP